MRRSYLILAKDWHAMADRQLEIQSPPLIPKSPLEQLAIALQAEVDAPAQAQ